MANRIRRVSSEKEFEAIIDDFITTGYTIKSRGETNALLIKKGKHDKHLLIFLLAGWWSFGLANLIYALIPMKNEDEIMIKIEEKE